MLDQLWEEFDERKDLDEKEQWVQRNGEDTTNAIIVLHIDLWLAGSFVDFKTGYAPGSLKVKKKRKFFVNCMGRIAQGSEIYITTEVFNLRGQSERAVSQQSQR